MTFEEDIRQAVECMRRGGVILYPTDTVWGIGCDAASSEAVRRVFEIKRRAESKALITLVGDTGMLSRYVPDAPDVAYELVEAAVSPLTVVYDRPRGLAHELLAADGSAAIRGTAERYSRALCTGLRRPVVSTSANISGQPTPARYADISPEIIAAVDYVATYRRDDPAPHRSSSIIKITDNAVVTIIRK